MSNTERDVRSIDRKDAVKNGAQSGTATASLQNPCDLPGFASVPSTNGSALRRDTLDGQMFGMSYLIAPADCGSNFHRLAIEAWTYGVHGPSMHMPVMDFTFAPDDIRSPDGVTVRDLKILSRPIEHDPPVAAKALPVALFFIQQINAGQVPDWNKVLDFHGLGPGFVGRRKRPIGKPPISF